MCQAQGLRTLLITEGNSMMHMWNVQLNFRNQALIIYGHLIRICNSVWHKAWSEWIQFVMKWTSSQNVWCVIRNSVFNYIKHFKIWLVFYTSNNENSNLAIYLYELHVVNMSWNVLHTEALFGLLCRSFFSGPLCSIAL
jgi:hypothetical protein